jgi:ATP-dependent helicase/nuclease subunit A
VPVHAYDGLQVISGRIDLLVDGPEGEDWFVIYDHKGFPGASDKWDDKARKHAPQLGSYAKAVETAIGNRKRCAGCFVHMPVRGAIIGIQMQGAEVAEPLTTIA